MLYSFDISVRPCSTLSNDIWTTALYSDSTLQILSTLLPFICFLLKEVAAALLITLYQRWVNESTKTNGDKKYE